MPYVSTKRVGSQHASGGRVTSGSEPLNSTRQVEPPPPMAFTPANVSMVIGKHENDIKRVMKSIEEIKSVSAPEYDSSVLDEKIDALDTALEEISKRVDAHDALEKKLGEMSKKVAAHDALEKKLGEMSKKVVELEKKLADAPAVPDDPTS